MKKRVCSEKKGFTLIEMMLVLAVMMAIVVVKAQQIQTGNMSYIASTLSQQVRTVADAANSYIVMNYAELSKLSGDNVSCQTDGVCSVTVENLKNQNFLPPNYNDSSVFKNPYVIQLKRTGSAPNYMFKGVVLTKGYSTNVKANPVILGEALKDIGQDGGLNTKDGYISGLMSKWSATSTDFPTLEGKINYIGAYIGSLSGAYNVYLRRDGSLPMTGNLNMGGNSINNAQDINADGNVVAGGNISAGGTVTAGGQVIAHNGYGDKMELGGDAYGDDYEIRLDSAKMLNIYSPNAASYTTVLKIDNNMRIGQRLGLMGLDPNNLPSGWGGGLRTFDVYASGTVATGDDNGNIAAGMNSTGRIWATGEVSGNTLLADSINTEGASCSTNGLISKLSNGTLLSCVNNRWVSGSSGILQRVGTNSLSITSSGSYKYLTVQISTKFYAQDGSNSRYANFNVLVNGNIIDTINNEQDVRKSGNKGHYWGYDGTGVIYRGYSININSGDVISIQPTSSNMVDFSNIIATAS